MKVFEAGHEESVRVWLDQGFEKAAERALLATGNRLVATIQNEIIPKEEPKPVDRGIYRAAWRAKKIKGGAEVYNTAPHAVFIEYGVRAQNVKIGPAMINALEQWVMRKGIASKKEARSVAYAIAMSMKKKGIFNRGGRGGLRILDKALDRLGDFLNKEFQVEIRREFEKR